MLHCDFLATMRHSHGSGVPNVSGPRRPVEPCAYCATETLLKTQVKPRTRTKSQKEYLRTLFPSTVPPKDKESGPLSLPDRLFICDDQPSKWAWVPTSFDASKAPMAGGSSSPTVEICVLLFPPQLRPLAAQKDFV